MSKVIWLTGLSGAGKTVIAKELKKLVSGSVLLDGDNLRSTLNSDLGFSMKDRTENIRRALDVALTLYNEDVTVLGAFITPLELQREKLIKNIPKEDLCIVHVSTPLSVCENRDIKGLYKRAREGELKDFTGIDSPYEIPKNSDLSYDTIDGRSPEAIGKDIYSNVFYEPLTQEPHDAFIGRWAPFHKGHFAIMNKVYLENKRPLLILVRDSSFDKYDAETRKEMVERSLRALKIPSTVCIIPDIKSINWGRGVGYETNLIDVDEEVKKISGTKIRELMLKGDAEWEYLVASGSIEFMKNDDK